VGGIEVGYVGEVEEVCVEAYLHVGIAGVVDVHYSGRTSLSRSPNMPCARRARWESGLAV
jgi:hypothetical protein